MTTRVFPARTLASPAIPAAAGPPGEQNAIGQIHAIQQKIA